MSTENYKENPPKKRRSKRRADTYRRWYQEIKDLHGFSFRYRPKSDFTPAQKSAITRKYRELSGIADMLKADRGIFKPAKRSQLRNLKSESFTITNKGVYVPGVRSEEIKKKRQAVRITGKGKNTRINVKLPARKEIFIPYPGEPNFIAWCNEIIERYKPDSIYIMNENGRGKTRWIPRLFERYATRDLIPRINWFTKKYNRIPFVGIWLVYENGHRAPKI